jgi:hypothetical protein
MALSVGQKVRHPAKSEWGLGEVLEVRDQKVLVNFEEVGKKLLKGVSLIKVASTNQIKRERIRPKASQKIRKKKSISSGPKAKKEFYELTRGSSAVVSPREPSRNSEFETTLRTLEGLRRDLGTSAEANTALLLYTLLQTPGITAHNYLLTLGPEVRGRLFVEAWEGAQGRQNGISEDHIRYVARRVAKEICKDKELDSRHLLLACMVGSGWLARSPELPALSTESDAILANSNFAVRAMRFAGINPVQFLDTIRARAELSQPPAAPSFFIFWPQRDHTRVLRVEEVGEFYHRPTNNIIYPTTLGLLDTSVGKSLSALLEFEELLNNSSTPEAVYQRFFEDHPEFLLTDQHLAVKPGVLLSAAEGFGLKPDFFLQRRDAPLWDIAELKLPKEKLVQGRPARRGLAAAVRWGMDQLQRYREYFLDSGLAKTFHETHGLEVYHPKLTLIIGRDEAFGSYQERQRLAPPESRILTYDDLLRLAKHRSLVLPFSDVRQVVNSKGQSGVELA